MQFAVKPGKYVVAVSGGVDSMVLLDLLRRQPDVSLVVAHFDHGIRDDSVRDRKLVEEAAVRYGLPCISEQGHLGSGTSEAAARTARYAFLRRVKETQGADAIITAHHQDDVLETAILNMLRGTGRKGLASLRSVQDLVRPLLHVSKDEIRAYAAEHKIRWHEDTTNSDDAYLRNYIRHRLMPRLGETGKAQLLEHVEAAAALNLDIDELLLRDLQAQPSPSIVNRYWFIMLPYDVSGEAMAAWLRLNGITQFDRRTIERLVIAAKVAAPGKEIDVNAAYLLKVSKKELRLLPR